MRVIAMFRVSTDAQAELGASLEAQQRKFAELAKLHGWAIVATFRGAESGTQANADRQVLQDVLACIRAEQPDALYVHEQSRLTRGDELEVAMLLRELRELRIKIIVGGVVRDLASIDERFMVGIQSLVDRAEAERIRERSMRGKLEKARMGRKNCGLAPFGYRNPPRGDPNRGILQIVPEQAASVRRMFELAAGGRSAKTIARTLNREGYPSPRGRGWNHGSVVGMLRNRVYIGMHMTGAWKCAIGKRGWPADPSSAPGIIAVPDAHEAIISHELWDKVQHRIGPARSKNPSLLTGLLHIDGDPVRASTCRGQRFYRLPRQHPSPHLWAEDTERLVFQELSSVLTDPAIVEACVREARGERNDADTAERLRQARARLAKLEGRGGTLLQMRLDNEINKDEYAALSAAIKADTAAAKAQVEQIESEQDAADPDALRLALDAIRIGLEPLHTLDRDEQRSLLRRLLDRIDIHAQKGRPKRNKGRFVKSGETLWTISNIAFTFGLGGVHRVCHSTGAC